MEKSNSNKFYLRTYGCQMNKYDSEVVKTLFKEQGFREVENIDEADYILLNTCAVREHAETRVLGRLNSLKHLKDENPDVKIGVMGCMAKELPELVENPVVDFVSPPDSYRNLAGWLKQEKTGLVPENKDEQYSEIFIGSNTVSAYLSITRGCDYFCSFCIVPYTRGRIRSRPADEILEEAEGLVNQGVGNITLLGQNINAYYYKGIDFPAILGRVAEIKGIKRLNFLTSHPMDVPFHLFPVMMDYDNITKYLHLPLQSGSDSVLKRMRRGYMLKDYVKLIDRARAVIPDVTVTTDLIVGFPGETEDDFQKTLSAVRKIRFDRAYMFSYSRKEGTLASLFDGFISKSVKKNRLQQLIQIQNKITVEKRRDLLGELKECFVIKEAKRGGKLAKTLDGKIIIINKVAKIGLLYIVRIKEIHGWTPIGKIIKEV